MRTMRILLTALVSTAMGQEFEVVSVKPNKSASTGSHSHSDPGMLTENNVSLKSMIGLAYGLRDYQVEGPDWLNSERFDVAAKFPEALPKEREKYNAALSAMMRKMLVERFKLSTHRDRRNSPVYALLTAKSGIKFKEVPEGDSHSQSRNTHYTGTGVTMATFAEFLSRRMDLPVLDMTGLKGAFSLALDWAPESRPLAGSSSDVPVAADSNLAPTLAIAIQEQLGLKVEMRKLPIEILVVDHAERVPTEN
jgi:uncharacterized protein (TIGR03435 family)